MTSFLYLVATPIGNLDDITLRAINILKEVDLILSENPKTTNKILQKYNIKKPLKSFHHHSSIKKISEILQLLKQGNKLAFVSEAGTPGISDPGGKLVQAVVENLPREVKIIPLPGASALASLVSVSGFNMNRFLFLGFLPKKKKRQKFLKRIKETDLPVVIYESVHRIEKLLNELAGLEIEEIVMGRELTKKFEHIYRGSPGDVLVKLKNDKIKGEFTIIVKKP
jgi:16S rRNA (cytidine1402-2'-O)-methyltransferase